MIGRLFVCMVAMVFFCAAQVTMTSANETTGQSPMIAQSVPPANLVPPEAKLVDTWLNMAGQFNDRLLTTVYWSLGAIGAVFAGLVGFGWFVNYRVYERDKAAMTSELRSEIARELSEVRNTLSALVEERSKASRDEIMAGIDAKFSELSTRVTEAGTRIKEVETSATHSIKWVQIKFYEIEADDWKRRDVPINEIRALGSALGISSELGEGWRCSRLLTRIGDVLDKKRPSRGDWEPDLVAVLDRVPPEFETLKERIRMLINRVGERPSITSI